MALVSTPKMRNILAESRNSLMVLKQGSVLILFRKCSEEDEVKI